LVAYVQKPVAEQKVGVALASIIQQDLLASLDSFEGLNTEPLPFFIKEPFGLGFGIVVEHVSQWYH
jgi:hypothetical protein